MSENFLSAAQMDRAVAADPQFQLPERPRLVKGLIRVRDGNTLIVEGGPSRQAFRGRTATNLLPRLMDGLDGQRTVTDLAGVLGGTPTDTRSMLALLYSTGLLEDTAPQPAEAAAIGEPCPVAPALSYLSRSLDTTRVNTTAEGAMSRLGRAVVVLASAETHGEFSRELAKLLEAEHVGRVVLMNKGELPRDTTLLLSIGTGAHLESIGQQAREQGVDVLPVMLTAGQLFLGPRVDTSHSACISCVSSQRDVVLKQLSPEDAADATGRAMAAAVAVREILPAISRVGSSETSQHLIHFDLDLWHQRRHALTPHPHCLVCMDGLDDWQSAGGPKPGVPLAWAFQHSVSFPPRKNVNPKDHQVHYKSGNIALQRTNPIWPSAPSVDMEVDTTRLNNGATPQNSSLDITAISTLLALMAGLREPVTDQTVQVSRWCATGGNLGSTTCYLIVRSIPGIAPGVYGYQRADNTLALLPWADPHTAIAGLQAEDPAGIVLTGAMETVAGKYGTFAWRILHLDAGAAVAQGNLVAAALGLGYLPQPAWEDELLATLLGTRPESEPVTGFIRIIRKGENA